MNPLLRCIQLLGRDDERLSGFRAREVIFGAFPQHIVQPGAERTIGRRYATDCVCVFLSGR